MTRPITPADIERILDGIDFAALIAKHRDTELHDAKHSTDMRRRPVRWKGDVFASVKALEDHTGISNQRILYHLNRHGDLSRLEAKVQV